VCAIALFRGASANEYLEPVAGKGTGAPTYAEPGNEYLEPVVGGGRTAPTYAEPGPSTGGSSAEYSTFKDPVAPHPAPAGAQEGAARYVYAAEPTGVASELQYAVPDGMAAGSNVYEALAQAGTSA